MLKGKTAIITGSNRGMGKKIAETFARDGADLFLHARTQSGEFELFCEKLKEKYSVSVTPAFFDLSNAEEIKLGVKTIFASKVPIHILVNNAGVIHNALLQMTKMDDLQQTMNINFFAPYLLTQYVLKRMPRNSEGGASIINMASAVGIDCNFGMSAYAASKAALIAMTKSLAKEVAAYGIRVNAVAPGAIQTDMLMEYSEQILDNIQENTALGRLGTVDDVANTVAFLASDQSSYITGQVIRVDGGWA